MIDQQAVVNLGAGSGVVNSVPQFTGGRRGVLHAASAVPNFSMAVRSASANLLP